MISKSFGRKLWAIPVVAAIAGAFMLSAQTPKPSAVKMVVWKPRAGMEKQFEEGYKRHLEWHRNNHDTWTWHGWFFSSGARPGWFMDAAPFRAWSDFDAPVNPAQDLADNSLNVMPYGDVMSVATYEFVAPATDLTPVAITSPLLTVHHIPVRPGAEAAFEAQAAKAFHEIASPPAHALLRPADGASEYLLLVESAKASELPRAAELLRALTAGSPSGSTAAIDKVTSETARYRADMSYVPE